MGEVNKYRLFLKFAILGIFIYMLFVFQGRQFSTSVASAQAPEISVAVQANVPIRISAVTLNSSDPLTPDFTYLVTNISQKPIDAYVIRIITTAKGASDEKGELRYGDSAASVMQPNHAEWGAYEGQSSSEPVQRINLMVDFVRFTDGTTWGADKYQFSEWITGHLAGVQAENARLLEIKKQTGLDAVVGAVAAEAQAITPQDSHSSQWNEGFRGGISTVRKKLKRAYEQGGAAQVEEELKRI
jgi:hypothetical protein